jgi:dihydroorotase
MSLYLTDATDPQEISWRAKGWVHGAKLYPAGATTHWMPG